MSEACRKKNKELFKKYRPIEQDPNVKLADKLQAVMEWWVKDMENIADEKLSLAKVKQIPITSRIYFRHGISEFLTIIRNLSLDFLVVSAGVGDIVKYSFELLLDEIEMSPLEKMHIISNFGIY